MSNLKLFQSAARPVVDEAGVCSSDIPYHRRLQHAETVIQRFFVGKCKLSPAGLSHEALVRSINPGPDFASLLREEEAWCADGFGPELAPPSVQVEQAFRDYGLTELGAVVLARLIEWDNAFIHKGWRTPGGALTEKGIQAYGAGQWRPFRVASNGEASDTVTPSGVLLLPDVFELEYYSTGDIAHPLAILHHELKAHVLPLKAAEGLVPGREMELICVRLESEMLEELGLPQRRLNWGRDDGVLDHTLDERTERYYHGLVRYDENGTLVQVDPDSGRVLGPAKPKG